MIDRAAIHTITYGLYLVASQTPDGTRAGCAINTLQQVASAPVTLSISLNKDNATTRVIQATGRYTASVLSQNATMELIGAFGFKSSLEFDKFADLAVEMDASSLPCVTEQSVATFSVKVEQTVDVGTHLLFIGTVEEAHKLSDEPPMTYDYYRRVLRGKTPPKAASFLAGEEGAPAAPAACAALVQQGAAVVDAATAAEAEKPRYAWQCTVCGHIEYVDELPDDFVCPICGVGKELFERIEL